MRLSPDGRRIAFTNDGRVFVTSTEERAPAVELASLGELCAAELAWSPDGSRLAYQVIDPTREPSMSEGIAWVRVDEPGERGRADGLSFSWTPTANALIVADPSAKAVGRCDVASGTTTKLADLDDDGDPLFSPRIAVSPDGARIAFTSRRVEHDVTEVWILERKEKVVVPTMFTEVPGALVRVLPFWSPKGVSLGLHIAHVALGKTALVVVPRLEGEGETLYDNTLIDPARTPAWSPSGRSIALLHTERAKSNLSKTGPARVALLDVSSGKAGPISLVTGPGEIEGPLHFLDDRTLAVDGGPSAMVLRFAGPV